MTHASELISLVYIVLYVSFIQVISLSPVPKSGPGTSTDAPIKFFFASSRVYLRMILSNSPSEYKAGLIAIPPLAPPNGRSTDASL